MFGILPGSLVIRKSTALMASISPTLATPFSLELVKTFDLVVAHGSFTAAAEHLGLTQPAISQQMRNLEKQLGVRLLERVGRRVTPTAAGADLLGHLPQITLAMDAAFQSVCSYCLEIAGQVRIGTGVTTCLYLLPDLLRRLRQAHPRLDLVVSTGNTDDLVRRVQDNLLDLALVTLPVAAPSLSLRTILEDELVAIKGAGCGPWPDPVGAESLMDRPLVMFSPGTSTRGLIDAWFGSQHKKPRPSMELDSVEAIKAVVAAGLGYSLLPRMSVTGRGSHPDLDWTPVCPPLRRTQAIAMRHDKVLSAALRTVVDAICEAAKA